MNSHSLHAVVAGDIIGSSELSTNKRRQLAEILQSAYDDVAGVFGRDLPYEIAVSAGDEWRIFVDRPRAALAASLAFWARLRQQDIRSRMVLVIDEIDFIDNGDLNSSDGAAFRRAGRGLSAVLGDKWIFALLLPEEATPISGLAAELAGELVDVLLRDLTAAQARPVAEMICGISRGEKPTTSEIAERWAPEPISRQAVGKHLSRSRWPALRRTLDRFERITEHLKNDI